MSAAVDVCIVAFGSDATIEACVRSALALPGVGTVAVVDHGDGASALRAEALGATVFHDASNPGFGAGQNRAVRAGTAAGVLLLNPDAELVPGGVEDGLKLLAQRPDVGAVQGAVLSRDGDLPDRSQGDELGPLHLFGRAVGARRVLRYERVRSLVGRMPWLSDTARRVPSAAVEVESLAATALLVRRAAFEEVGGFDESYFLYGEDLDLCRRLRGAGWRLIALPEPWAIHAAGSSATSPWDRELSWWRGTMQFAARWWSNPRWAAAVAAAAVRCAGLVLSRPSGAHEAVSSLLAAPLRDRRGK